MPKKIQKKCKKINLVISDVDGVLTDGGMYYSDKGEIMKKFNTRDGMGVELLLNNGIKTILITRENSIIVKKRARKIRVEEIYTGIKKKKKLLPKICKKYKVSLEEIAYIGDDINDLDDDIDDVRDCLEEFSLDEDFEDFEDCLDDI